MTEELRKAVSKDNFIVKLIKQLETRLIEGFIIIKTY